MESKRIYLPIETTKRELISRMSFAIESAQAGWEPIFASKTDFLRKIKFLKSGHYIGKSLQPGNYKHYKQIKSYGNSISVFDEEGLFSFDQQFSNRRIGQNNFELIENYFLWGEENRNELLMKFKSVEEKLVLAGNQRIELLKEPMINLFLDNANKIKEKYGSFILVTTKFPKVNFIKRPDLQDFVEHQIQKGWLFNNHLVECATKSHNHEKQNLKHLISLVQNLSIKKPKETIIVRPHPNEDYSTYDEAFKKFKNIKIIKDHDNTNNWIAASKYLIHFNCTTGLEAFLLNKRSFNFMPFKDESVEYNLLKEITEVVRSENDINKIDLNFDKSIPSYEKKLEKLEKYIHNVNDKKFSEIVLKQLSKNPNYGKNIDRYTNKIYFNLIKLRFLLVRVFKKKKIDNFQKKSLQKLNPYKKKDIYKIYLDLLDKMKIKKKDLIFKEIFPRMFLLKKS